MKNSALVRMIAECASLVAIARVIAIVNVSFGMKKSKIRIILNFQCAPVLWLDVNVIQIFVNHVVQMILHLPMKTIPNLSDAKMLKFNEANINIFYLHHQMLLDGESISR